ncbi:hypothetical protein [Nocardia grenadensis]|uniref:hypothetical protein n=1 Tax=Nocardia grenadensis TaxID=931537 RepID=UPI0007A4BA1F|nr:hypothetical protein [Nocardia grenadensis]
MFCTVNGAGLPAYALSAVEIGDRIGDIPFGQPSAGLLVGGLFGGFARFIILAAGQPLHVEFSDHFSGILATDLDFLVVDMFATLIRRQRGVLQSPLPQLAARRAVRRPIRRNRQHHAPRIVHFAGGTSKLSGTGVNG